jgi:hypothetical protein
MRLASFLLLFVACRPVVQTPAAPRKTTIFLTHQLLGTLAPCGCSANMRGGISRSAKLIRDVPNSVFLDVGSALFPAKTIPLEAKGQQEARAKALSEIFKNLELSAHIPGEFDEALGSEFLKSLALPSCEMNKIIFISNHGISVAVLWSQSISESENLAQEARNKGAQFVLAAVDVSSKELMQHTAKSTQVDAWISRNEINEENRGLGLNSKIIQLQTRGRSIARIDLSVVDGAKVEWIKGRADVEQQQKLLEQRIEMLRAQTNEPGIDPQLLEMKNQKLVELLARKSELSAGIQMLPAAKNAASLQFIGIEQTLPQDEVVAAIEKNLDVSVGQANLKFAQEHGKSCAMPSLENPGVVGTEMCSSCHPAAAEFWKKTKHAQAYEALKLAKKEFHLDCVGCHVTGWQKPGGVCRIDETQGRQGVGCESCHGFGMAHISAPSKSNITTQTNAETCRGCHDAENSPHFDFERWRMSIVGEGHGAHL